MSRFTLPAFALALVVAACGSETGPAASADPTEAGSTTVPTTTTTSASEGEDPAPEVPPDDDYGVDPYEGDEPEDTSGPTTTIEPDNPDTAATPEVPQPPVVGEAPADLIDAILADAATRSGTTNLSVVRDAAVVWSDGSLGCPEPGVLYTQATVAGFWVVLEHPGGRLDYRTSGSTYYTPCQALPGGEQQPPDKCANC